MYRLRILMILLCCSGAAAQNFYSYTDFTRQINQGMDIQRDWQRRSNVAPTALGEDRAVWESSLSFVPAKSVSSNMTKYMLNTLSKEQHKPVSQILLEMAALNNTELPPVLISRMLNTKNWPKNNFGSFSAVFMIISYNTLTGKTLESQQEQVLYERSLRPTSKSFGDLSDEKKQMASELMAWNTLRIYEQNRRNPEAGKKLALNILSEFGLDQAMLEKLVER